MIDMSSADDITKSVRSKRNTDLGEPMFLSLSLVPLFLERESGNSGGLEEMEKVGGVGDLIKTKLRLRVVY